MLPSTLLIGYYNGLLLKDVNHVDFLINKMLLHGLLNFNEEKLILTGHSAHQRNQLLLEHVRHMQTQTLMIFCGFVQEIVPKVGLQLVTGMRTLTFS